MTTAKQAGLVEATSSLVDETRALFHRMKLAAEQLHAAEGITAGMRGVLFGLASTGPQTVPQMARQRPVSRQHIQTLVNPLVDKRLVRLVDNPAHRRSKLVELTAAGQRLVERMGRREAKALGLLSSGLSESRLRSAAATLRALRERFEEMDA
jgi:DNA-binding MarR family transcriptional regulator